MPRLRIEIDQQTYDKLAESAVRELRPIVWHAEVLIRRALAQAEPLAKDAVETGAADMWPEPAPLPDSLPPVEPFEPLLLPEAVRPWVEDIAERMQCPLDYPAVAAMVALAAGVGRRLGIRPKRRDDWLVVANLWGGVIGRPGLLKTPAILEPLRPLQALEAAAGEAYQAALTDWKARQLVAKELEKVVGGKIREALKEGHDATHIAEELVGDEEPPPVRRRYLVNDSTVEKLGELLNQNPHGLLVFRDELTGLLRSLDREGAEGARAFYLEAWNGTGRFIYDRIGRGTIEIEAACVSLLGSIQPGPLAHYLKAVLEGGVGDDGLIQRFQLLVWPDVTVAWKDIDEPPKGDAKAKAYEVFDRLNRLDPAALGADGEEAPGAVPSLRFAPDAQEVFTEWRTQLEHRLRGTDDPPALQAHLAKYRSLVPSLALLIHLADGGGNPVGLGALERACAWSEYLESHARRVYSPALSPEVRAARALAAHLGKGALGQAFALRDVYRHQWSDLSSRADAQAAVDLLPELDWLAETREETGTRPRRRFLVDPRIGEHPGK